MDRGCLEEVSPRVGLAFFDVEPEKTGLVFEMEEVEGKPHQNKAEPPEARAQVLEIRARKS